jgi:hypothetical protein
VIGPLLELELAVARDREYLIRAVFRGPDPVSIGTNPRAVVTLPDDQLPDFFEFVHLSPERSYLAFESDMTVEWLVGGERRGTEWLIETGMAREGVDAWEIELEVGSKGRVLFGPLQLLLKVQAQRDLTIWSAADDGGPTCGGCGARLRWALAGGGALSPCQRCGDLNRVESTIADLEMGATRAIPAFPPEPLTEPPRAPLPRRSRPVPTPSPEAPTISDAEAPGVPIPAPKGADLPTFDAIEVGAQVDPPTAAALKAGSVQGPGLLAPQPGHGAALAPQPGHGAELPTFDAISAFKGDAALSTKAAISVMKGAEEGEPPVSQGPTSLGPPGEAASPPPATPSPTAAEEGLTSPHRYPPPERNTDHVEALSTDPTPAPEPPTPEPAPESATLTGADATSDEDDFLMGRSDGGIRTEPFILGWVLIGSGLMAGMAGMGLLLFAVLRWTGLL